MIQINGRLREMPQAFIPTAVLQGIVLYEKQG